jgi:hypothetical protein
MCTNSVHSTLRVQFPKKELTKYVNKFLSRFLFMKGGGSCCTPPPPLHFFHTFQLGKLNESGPTSQACALILIENMSNL